MFINPLVDVKLLQRCPILFNVKKCLGVAFREGTIKLLDNFFAYISITTEQSFDERKADFCIGYFKLTQYSFINEKSQSGNNGVKNWTLIRESMNIVANQIVP